MCFHMVIKTDEGSAAPYLMHILESLLLALSLFTILLIYPPEFVVPQFKMIYFASEGHKPGWLASAVFTV